MHQMRVVLIKRKGEKEKVEQKQNQKTKWEEGQEKTAEKEKKERRRERERERERRTVPARSGQGRGRMPTASWLPPTRFGMPPLHGLGVERWAYAAGGTVKEKAPSTIQQPTTDWAS